MPKELENQKHAAAPPVKKTVVVPKNADVPIRQAKTNIFDPRICQQIDWQEDRTGNHVGAKMERMTPLEGNPDSEVQQPNSSPTPEGQPPNSPPTPEDQRELSASSVPRQTDGSFAPGGGGCDTDDVPDWVRQTLKNARIPHHC